MIASFAEDYEEAEEEEDESEGSSPVVIAIMIAILSVLVVVIVCCFMIIRRITRKRAFLRLQDRVGSMTESSGVRILPSAIVVPALIGAPTAFTIEDLDSEKPTARKGIPIARITDTNLNIMSAEVSSLEVG